MGPASLCSSIPIRIMGDRRDSQLDFGPEEVRSVPELPDKFTNILPDSFKTKNPLPTKGQIPKSGTNDFGPQIALEHQWLEKVVVTKEMNDAVPDLLTHFYLFTESIANSFTNHQPLLSITWLGSISIEFRNDISSRSREAAVE